MPILLQKNIPYHVDDPQGVIEHRLREGRGQSFIHIVPTNRKVRDAERKYLRLLPGTAGERFRLFTLQTLAVEFHAILSPLRRFVDGPSQAVLFQQAMRRIAPSLRYFKLYGGSRFPHRGTLQKIINVINKLKSEGVYPSLLQMELGGVNTDEEVKLRDLLAVYEEYERLLGTRYVDPAGYLKSINEQWDQGTAEKILEHFFGVDLVVISGFDKFSDPEITMLASLSDLRGLGTVISFDYSPDNHQVFGHLEENYKKFLQIGFSEVRKWNPAPSAFRNHIAKRFWRQGSEVPIEDTTRRVSVCSAQTRKDEVELIAKIIKRLIHDQPDLRPVRICVTMFQPKLYTNLFREVFSSYEIPANITDRFPLDQSPCIIGLLSLLTVQEHNFRLRDIMRALTTPYFSFGVADDAVDPGNLYARAIELKIPAGFSTWMRRIQRRLTELHQRISAVGDDIEEWQLLREERGLRKAEADLKRLSEILHPFTTPMRPQEFRERIQTLLADLHIVDHIISSSSPALGDEQREKDARALQKFLYFLDEYLEVIGAEDDNHDSLPLSFYLDTLRTAIPHIRYNIRQKWASGVLVTTLEETRGLEFDVMIIAGLVDGEFPPVYRPEILVSKKRQDITEHFHPVEHRYLFYQVATNFDQRLYLTFPRKDGNRQLLPSPYIEALGSVIRLNDMQGDYPPEIDGHVFSITDVIRHAGTLPSVPDAGESEVLRVVHLDDALRATLDHMRLAIRVETSRLVTADAPSYGGMILDGLRPDAVKSLRALRDKVYSVTQLEAYGKCPFHFFAGRILRLAVTPEPEDRVTPLERGSVVHEILFEFYVERRKEQLPPLSQCDDREFALAMNRLQEIAKSYLERFGEGDLLWDIEKEKMLGTAGRRGILNEFLVYERSCNYAIRPTCFEMAFGSQVGGRKATDPEWTVPEPVRVDRVLLRGKIDRVDVGEHALKVVDYKTGGVPFRKDDILAGVGLQLPLYLHVVERILAGRLGKAYIPAAGVYYRLRDPVREEIGIGSNQHRGVVFDKSSRSRNLVQTDEELRGLIATAVTHVNRYVDYIASGRFPVEPKDPGRTCIQCEFITVCRIQNIVVPDQDDTGKKSGQ